MKRWIEFNWGAVVTQLVAVAIMASVGMWFRNAISEELKSYITDKVFSARNEAVDDRFDKLEKYVQDGRVERMAFQRDVVDRLARIEEQLKQLNKTKP
jgi:hypothetical protein